MGIDRRNFLQSMAALFIGLRSSALAQSYAVRQDTDWGAAAPSPSDAEKREGRTARSVRIQTPDIPRLPYKVENGVKVFHLIAQPLKREFVPGKVFDVWGYNGSMPGPTIEVNEGDRVRIFFENRLPEPTTVHWHGIEVPIEMDGVPAISQPLVKPGEKYVYEFTLHQHGTFFYHSHMPMQEMLGLIGMFVIHPAKPYQPHVDKDFALILQEWAILPNNTIPNSMSMEFNWLTINGKAGPDTTPLIVKLGERVRIRFVNLGMDHHPMHIHGHQFVMTGTEGGRVPESAWFPQNTVLVGVAQARVIEFEATHPGDWMLHCHLPHHMMNQMVSMVGPMAHGGAGVHTGMGMEEGMGMVRQGQAMDEELGPGLGRGMGMAAREKPVSHMAGMEQAQGGNEHKPGAMEHEQSGMEMEKKRVPGFPQDMWMPMDEAVAKPETYGLALGWSGAVTGMMTLVRILPPEKYERIMKLIGQSEQRSRKGKR